MPHSQPTPTPSAAAQSLRERIGQENMTQSSVLATRRLDQALLRLDRAAGRSRAPEDLDEAQSHPVHRSQRSRLELDHTISQSTSVWLEVEDTGQQMRTDVAPAQPKPEAPHFRSAAAPLSRAHSPSAPATSPPSSAPQLESSLSAEALEAFFTHPIDVMILSTTARIASHRDPASQAQATPPTATPLEATPLEAVPPTAAEAKVAEPQSAPATTAKPKANKPTTIEPAVTAKPPTAAEATTATPAAAEPPAAAKTQCQPAVSTAPPQSKAPEPIAKPAPLAPAAVPHFVAAWQVNEFIVPSTIDQLFLAGSIAEQLATRLALAQEQGLRTIAITSTRSGEGRSTVAIGMALSVAFSGLRVALVDADRDGVNIASDLHLDLDQSWVDALRNRLPLEEVAVYSVADSLTLLPLLNRVDQEEAPFVSSELRECLARLRESFDMVIVDCGPCAIADITLCDTCLIVRDVQRTEAVEVETLAMSLRRSGSQGVGIIENFC